VLQDYGDELAFQLAMQPGLLQSLSARRRGVRASSDSSIRRGFQKSALSARLRRQIVKGRLRG
jgi:hypothetical protein